MALKLRTIYILSVVEPRLKVPQPRYNVCEAREILETKL